MTESTREKGGTEPAVDGPPEQDAAFAEVYAELRSIARREYRRNPQPTLNTTAVIHEAWLKMRERGGDWNSRDHYIGTAAMAMRQVLVDYARYRTARKRDRDRDVQLFETRDEKGTTAEELLSLDQALDDLAGLDRRLADLVTLRFFAGLPLDEAADYLDISPRTAARDWKKARAWLQNALTS